MNTACTLQSLCSGISKQPAQLSKAPTASDHKREKLLSKTPCSRVERAAPSFAKLSSTPQERQSKQVAGPDPPSSTPKQEGEAAVSNTDRTQDPPCLASHSLPSTQRAGRQSPTLRVHNPERAHSWKKPSQPSSSTCSPSCSLRQRHGERLTSRFCSQQGFSPFILVFANSKVQV